MAKKQFSTKAIRTFFDEVVAETKKSEWPHRAELLESTAVVIMVVALLSAFVALSDTVLFAILRVVFNVG